MMVVTCHLSFTVGRVQMAMIDVLHTNGGADKSVEQRNRSAGVCIHMLNPRVFAHLLIIVCRHAVF
jgi:hypothetical protein